MWQVGLDEAAAMHRLTGAIPAILQWARTFVAHQSQLGALVDMGFNSAGPTSMCIKVASALYNPCRATSRALTRPAI